MWQWAGVIVNLAVRWPSFRATPGLSVYTTVKHAYSRPDACAGRRARPYGHPSSGRSPPPLSIPLVRRVSGCRANRRRSGPYANLAAANPLGRGGGSRRHCPVVILFLRLAHGEPHEWQRATCRRGIAGLIGTRVVPDLAHVYSSSGSCSGLSCWFAVGTRRDNCALNLGSASSVAYMCAPSRPPRGRLPCRSFCVVAARVHDYDLEHLGLGP